MKKWERYSRYLETGEWHCHTRYTDGRNTVAEMCRQASRNGLELIAFTEHVRKSLSYDFGRLVNDVKRARYRSPRLIETCRKMGARIVTGSDAHGTEDIRVLNPEDKGKPLK